MKFRILFWLTRVDDRIEEAREQVACQHERIVDRQHVDHFKKPVEYEHARVVRARDMADGLDEELDDRLEMVAGLGVGEQLFRLHALGEHGRVRNEVLVFGAVQVERVQESVLDVGRVVGDEPVAWVQVDGEQLEERRR
jgi:hypothetical protein